MKVRATASDYSLRVEVGPAKADDPEQFEFGMTAEVFVGDGRFGNTGPLPAEVSMGAIGIHSPAVARRRIASYAAAVELAEMIDRYVDSKVPFDTIAISLNSGLLETLLADHRKVVGGTFELVEVL